MLESENYAIFIFRKYFAEVIRRCVITFISKDVIYAQVATGCPVHSTRQTTNLLFLSKPLVRKIR